MLETTVVVSAPSKAILFGEHSVVYNRRALVACLQRRLKLTTICRRDNETGSQRKSVKSIKSIHLRHTLDSDGLIALTSRDLENFTGDFSSRTEEDDYFVMVKQWLEKKFCSQTPSVVRDAVGAILVILMNQWWCPCDYLEICVESDIPVGAGLGSSAAFSVSLAASLLVLNHTIPSESVKWTADHLQKVSRLAFVGEKLLHGSPSGLDNTIITFGGMASFSRVDDVNLMPIRNRIHLLIINTMVTRSTAAIVEKVRYRWEKEKEKFEEMFSSIESIVDEGIKLLSANYEPLPELPDAENYMGTLFEKHLAALFRRNHKLLRKMLVSHSAIEEVVDIVRDFGLTAKLTGAGEGGCLIAILPREFYDIEKVIKALYSKGYTSYVARLGGSGARVESYGTK